MQHRRSKFCTFILACIPGAGQMFLGFMKTGLSLMVAFFAVIFLSSFFNLSPLNYLLPIIWFYSFFDAINKGWSTDEEFNRIEDRNLFRSSSLDSINSAFHGKGKLILGIAAVLVGLKVLWDNFFSSLLDTFDPQFIAPVREFLTRAPQLVIAVLIIVLGVYLIIGKKRSVENND